MPTALPIPADPANAPQPGDSAGRDVLGRDGLLARDGLLGQIEVLGEIGRGAQAIVYRVRRGGFLYAMKVLQPAGADDETHAAAFRREAALLASVSDPGLARVHEVGTTDGRPYLLMDLVEGQRLSGLLAAGPLPADRVAALGLDVAGALAAAHRAGLVHRDVKPDNLMLTPDGTARLIDFGLAARIDPAHGDGARSDEVAGTLAYSSPEQSGMLNRPVDGRSDLYSLGAVLFECATGTPPFAAADVGELVRLHAVAPVPDPRDRAPGLSPALAGIIVRLLAKDPDDRYQTGDGLLHDLRRVAGSEEDFPLGTADAAWLVGAPGAQASAVKASAVKASAVQASVVQTSVAQDGPLVGLDDELSTLRSRWERALGNRGGVALVQGAPGGGKSRLVRELTGGARRDGHLVLHGRASADDPLPFAPLRAAVDGYVRSLSYLPDSESAAAVEQLKTAAGPSASLVKNLSPALAAVLAAPDPAGEVGQERYAAAVATFLTELAALAGGALLHLDDVQWCDDATVRVLEQMAAELGMVPMLVVGTARDDDASVPAVEAFRARLGGVIDTRVVLKPLDAAAVAGLVSALSGGLRLTDEAATRLAARSAGNPFTLIEYVKAIIDCGLAEPYWGTWRIDLDGLDALELPETAAELVLKRVDALDAQSRRLLGMAAAVGSRFDPDLVADVCGTDRQRVLDMVADAAWHRLVEPRADGRYAFLHEWIREALLGEFGEPARRQLHDRIADIIAQRPDQDPETVYALAHHRALGEPDHDPAGTFHACHAAGRLAMADHAPESALHFLEHAAEAAVRAEIVTDAAFGQLLGTAYHQAARLDDAVDALRRALDATRDPIDRARILYRIAQVHQSAWNSAAQVATAEQGLAELGRPMPKSLLLQVLASLWHFLLACLIALTHVGFGTARPRKRELYTLVGLLCESAGTALVRELQPTKSVAYVGRALYLANRVGRSPLYAVIMVKAGFLCRTVRLGRLADKLAAAAASTARDLGDPSLLATVAWMDAIGYHGSGKDSGESIHRLLEEHSRWLDFGLFLDAYAVVDWDWLLRGNMDEMEAGFHRRRVRAAAGGQSERSGVVATDACLLALRGRAGDAAAHLAKLIDDDAPLHQQVDVLIATFQAALEQNDCGQMFDDAVAKFAALDLKPLDLLPAQHTIYVYLAYGMLERCRHADDAARAARLADARKAIATLRKVTQRPIVAAHHRVTEAALYELTGEPAKALATLAAGEQVLRAVEAPLVAFEAALVRARALRALSAAGVAPGAAGETLRQAGYALAVAKEQGWPHRARWITAEFGLTNAGSVVHHGSTGVIGSRHSQRWTALEQVSLAASRVLDPEKLARIALDETIRILGADRAFLLLLDSESSRLVPHVGRDAAGNDLAELTAHSASLIERVRHDRKALVVTGTEEGEALGSKSMRAYGLRSILIAPLLLDGRLLGVVYLDSRVAKGVFTMDDVDILTAVTHHVAVAMETARAAQLEVAVEAANRQRDLAETLRDAMAWLSGTLDPTVVLSRLLTTVMRARAGEPAWLLLGEASASTVTVLSDGSSVVVDASPDLAGLLAVSEPGVYAVDGAWPRVLADGVDRPACFLVVPLVAREQRLGVLVLASRRPGAYGDADIGIATALVSQGMVAYENARLFTQVHELATVDSLTGVANRRHFFDIAGRAVAVTLARPRHAPVAAVMLDIDHFKRINDTYGHQVGDDVICGVVARLRSQSRDTDLLARYGGEEFVLLLSNSGANAAETAERLRASVAAAPIETRDGPVDVTISVGVTYLRPDDSGLDTLLGRADECLYSAKKDGRNRVVVGD